MLDGELGKTRGEFEAAVCEQFSQLQLELMGRGPKELRAHLVNDLLVIRMAGALSNGEQQIIERSESDKFVAAVKELRRHIINQALTRIDENVHRLAGVHVRSLLHDISRVTGEEFVILALTGSPRCRTPRSQG